ncbi:MAG: hypothetical protein PWR01_1573 [Clostridiales bacterium]|jgi:hypothetical protein|uniref:hypothetical protein n=1 Tax=Caldicoprobacter algeriensis TaxID=699281 RepID=UPI002079AAE7|nr:hypothetical protein [Caldicoprobacter algeriensis]MCM8901778.1 hypothetical protein [Caldicoprobacter algeriensis]MDN5277608.1 hypothetical protein [Clostridiales bacterium]
MSTKKMVLLTFVVLLLFLLVGCIPGDGTHTPDRPAGFFWGIWHGWLAPLSLIIGFFDRSIRIYEVNNSGWFYDLGFYIAVISGFGGISFVRRKKR